MKDIANFLKEMISAPGISGYETAIRPIIEKRWEPVTDGMSVSKLGSLHALQNGTGAEPRKRILVATHMDAVGLMINSIVDGFLHITSIGAIDVRVLPGQMVTVHGRQELPGMVVATPTRLLPASVQGGIVPLDYLLIDVGLSPEEVHNLVRVGDPVSFDSSPIETEGETMIGHSLDNRASVAALTHCLDLLHTRPHTWDVWAVATVQEEVSFKGGITSAFQLQPDLAAVIDTTFGNSQGSPSYQTFAIGKGPTIMWGPNTHPYLFKKVKELAEQIEMPVSVEPTPIDTGTDAIGMQLVLEGIPNLVIGIPLRYMHTPVEMVALKDITRAGRLAAEFISQLDENFMEKLAWDD